MNPAASPMPALDGASFKKIPTKTAIRHAIGTPSSVRRLRTDSWDFLAYITKQLTTAAMEDSSVVGLLGECFRLMDILDSIEMYFASPGVQHMAGP